MVLGRNGGPNGDQEYAIRSVDGGQALEATADIATIFFIYPFMRADPSLTSGVDADGNIYVVFPDCRFRSNCSDSIAVSGCRNRRRRVSIGEIVERWRVLDALVPRCSNWQFFCVLAMTGRR